METASFYDDRARVVQSQSDNYKGGHDTLTTLYNFRSTPLTTYLSHVNPVATVGGNTRIKTNMDYDSAMRLTEVYKTINDTSTRLLTQHTYDQKGQLLQKQLGQLTDGSFLETQAYSYNIRGWLKGINKDYANNDNSHGANNRWFGMDLSYDWGFATNYNQLNGNISGNKWRSKGDGYQRAYGFGYDDANRLLFADFNQYTNSAWSKTAGVDFSVTMGDGATPSTAYDDNGNIVGMKQMAWQIGGSNPIDRLRYGYQTNSNKLQDVIDSANNPQTTLGDFRTSSLSPYATSKTPTAVDYNYDPNGNLTRDLNKDIGTQTTDGIVYNHLNLPWQISVRSATGTKGNITYIYDATGTKLKKTTLDSVGNLQTVTTYIGAFQYQGRQALTTGSIPADTLQFIGDEEGRVRLVTDTAGGVAVNSFKHDYFLKDHLGNTRMVLTDEQETDQYPMASMEVGDSATENLYYTMLDGTRTSLPAGYPTDTTTKPNQYVAELYSNGNNTVIGPGVVLKVMAGDQFSVRATSWYQLNGTTPGTPLNPLTDVVTALVAGIAASPGEGATAAALQSNPAPLSPNVMQFLADTGSNIINTKPHAFLNWVLFDNQFNFVSASSGFQQVGANGALTTMSQLNLPITSSGYLYIYTSNATPNVPVFFDNLQVTHKRGPLLEENHYYPFGLTMVGICDMAIKSSYAKNKYLFQRQELQNKEFSDGSGLETMDFIFRMYDHQLGRFMQQDPLTTVLTSLSPYQFEANNPMLFIDPLGLDTVRVNGSGSHRIRIGQGDVLAWTTDGQTSYYTYDPSNKDAVSGFVGNGIQSSELPAAGVTATSKNSEKSGGELWMAGLSLGVGKADFANSMLERGKRDFPSAVGSNGHYPIIGRSWWSKVKGNEKFAEGRSYGLALLNSALTFRELSEQYKKGGLSGVSPVTAIDFGLGATGLGATSLKFLNVAPATMGSIAEFSGIGGAAIQSYYQWSSFYMMLDNTSKLPNNPTYSGTSSQQFQAALDDGGGGWGNPH